MKHTLTALLQDRPGALNRTVSLFRRRGYNIESLSVAPSERPGLSRVTIVVDEADIDQVVKQFTRLIEVVDVSDPSDPLAVERETALVKIQTRGAEAAEVAALTAHAGGRVLDATGSTMIVEMTAAPDSVAAFIDRMRTFGLLAVTRSGRVVMPRGTSPTAKTTRHFSDAPGLERQDATGWSSYLMPATPTPVNSQADGASDDVAA